MNQTAGDEETKLKLKKLRFEASWGSRLEIFKSVGSVIAALGVIGTLSVAFYQQSESRISRDDDRFDRSVARVGSSNTPERLTGLAGLQQFLTSGDADRQRAALLYLVNATAIETDPAVRGAMIDTFNSLRELRVAPSALNAGLLAARDRNRALLNRLFSRPWSATKTKPSFDVDLPELAMDPVPQLEKDELMATGGAIAALVRAGAKVGDLSHTFCKDCDFSSSPDKKIDLSGVNFDSSILRHAKFFGTNLDGSSFSNADLFYTDFTSASLKHAKLTEEPQTVPYKLQAGYATRNLSNVWGTTFACADLTDAEFSGQLVFGLIFNDPIFGGYGRDEFFGADLNDTNFIGAQFYVAVPSDRVSPGENSFPLGQLSPVGQAPGSGLSDPIDYVGNQKYVVWTSALSNDTGFTTPIKGPYRRSLIFVISSLGFAKNLDTAKLPPAVLNYIKQNKSIFEKPARSYDCKGNRSFDITLMFGPDDVGPKNTRP
ncbi:MAG TPA: pentapeptide repeat-containing protein [Terriglobales bacterium]